MYNNLFYVKECLFLFMQDFLMLLDGGKGDYSYLNIDREYSLIGRTFNILSHLLLFPVMSFLPSDNMQKDF